MEHEDTHPTIEEIKDWIKSPVTIEFMDRIKLKFLDADKLTHIKLENNELQDAALHNAGRAMCHEFLEEPERMVEDAKDEAKGE